MNYLTQNRYLQHGMRVIMTLMALLLIGGCSPKHITPPRIELTIKSNAETNNGQPFYIVIRSVNAKEFLTNSYQKIVRMIFADSPDPSFLYACAILPGKKVVVTVEKPNQTSLGVYALFTQPGNQWKRLFPQPLSSEYDIVLEKNTIKCKKEGFFKRLF